MPHGPTVSVLVTFYNQADYVNRAIESILEQETSFSIEILAGDDGSIDGTSEILARWCSLYPDMIRVFTWNRDQDRQYNPIERASANRLGLLRFASGEYIVFLDGDDCFTNRKKLQVQVDALKKNPECHSCCHNMDLRSAGGGNKLLIPKWLAEGKMSFYTYWSLFYTPAESFMFRASCLFVGGIDSSNFDDNTIVYLLARNGPVYYIPNVMAIYDQSDKGSWLAMSRDRQMIVNLFDYIFEIKTDEKFRGASTLRHLGELKWFLQIEKNPNHAKDMESIETLKAELLDVAPIWYSAHSHIAPVILKLMALIKRSMRALSRTRSKLKIVHSER